MASGTRSTTDIAAKTTVASIPTSLAQLKQQAAKREVAAKQVAVKQAAEKQAAVDRVAQKTVTGATTLRAAPKAGLLAPQGASVPVALDRESALDLVYPAVYEAQVIRAEEFQPSDGLEEDEDKRPKMLLYAVGVTTLVAALGGGYWWWSRRQ